MDIGSGRKNLSLRRFLPLAGASGRKCAASDELILGQNQLAAGVGRNSASRQAVRFQHVAEFAGCLFCVRCQARSTEGAPSGERESGYSFTLYKVVSKQRSKLLWVCEGFQPSGLTCHLLAVLPWVRDLALLCLFPGSKAEMACEDPPPRVGVGVR